MEEEKTVGQIGFEAYSEAMGGKTYDDKPIPEWSALPENVKNAWLAASFAMYERRTDDSYEQFKILQIDTADYAEMNRLGKLGWDETSIFVRGMNAYVIMSRWATEDEFKKENE